jgi:hypothetical protein
MNLETRKRIACVDRREWTPVPSTSKSRNAVETVCVAATFASDGAIGIIGARDTASVDLFHTDITHRAAKMAAAMPPASPRLHVREQNQHQSRRYRKNKSSHFDDPPIENNAKKFARFLAGIHTTLLRKAKVLREVVEAGGIPGAEDIFGGRVQTRFQSSVRQCRTGEVEKPIQVISRHIPNNQVRHVVLVHGGREVARATAIRVAVLAIRIAAIKTRYPAITVGAVYAALIQRPPGGA